MASLKSLGKRIHKEFKRELKDAANIGTFGGYHLIEKNWKDIRMPLAYAGAMAAIATGVGAGLGAMGLTGMGVGASAASGAVTGAVSGASTGAQVAATERANARAEQEQERIAAQEAEQARKLSLLQSGQTPEGVSTMDLIAKRNLRSQYKQNQKSRQTGNKTLGGSSSTLMA